MADRDKKVGRGNKSIGVILPEDLYEDLKALADERDWSLSQTARKLIEAGLDKNVLDKPKL